MLRLAALLLVVGGLCAAWFLVPFGGRSGAERWRAARDPAAFISTTWAELRGRPPEPPPRPKAKPRPPREHHSAGDRAELDRLLSERAR